MIRRRKDFLPTFILSIFLWLVWFGEIIFFAPRSLLIITNFFLLLFLSVFLTGSLFLANSRKGFLLALILVTFLILKWQDLANFLNIFLLFTAILIFELYFGRQR